MINCCIEKYISLISPQAPIVDDTMNDDISQWQKIYSGVVYQKSLTYKGPKWLNMVSNGSK